MRIRSERREPFVVPPEVLWEHIGRTSEYRAWWPWLRGLDAAPLARDARWTATIQPPLPYRLTFALHLHTVEAPRSVVAEVTGDIVGEASFEIEATPTGSELVLRSELAPSHPVLRAVAAVASPIARFGHDWVIETGLRQFRHHALGD